MSDTNTTNLSPRRIELPGASKLEVIAASPHQLARLRYFDVPVEEPLSSDDANRLISQINSDPAFAEKINAWESEKQALHPDLFRVPPRFSGLSVPAVPPTEPSPYAPIPSPEVPGFVPLDRRAPALPAGSSRTKLPATLAVTVLAVLAVLGTAGWFLWKSPWLQTWRKIAAASTLALPGSHPAAPGKPAAPTQPLLPAQSAAAVSTLPPEELARRVAESQRLAVARYPALGNADSELNMRFVFRYKRMLSEHSPRLQDPDWPVQLADECAAAAKIKPVGSTAGASGRSRGKSTPAGGSARPASPPVGS